MKNIMIVGHVSGQPLRVATTKDGTEVANFRFAEKRYAVNRATNQIESLPPNWYDGAVFGAQQIERYKEFLTNSKLELALLGDYAQAPWTDDAGAQRVANRFTVKQLFVAPARVSSDQVPLVESEPSH